MLVLFLHYPMQLLNQSIIGTHGVAGRQCRLKKCISSIQLKENKFLEF